MVCQTSDGRGGGDGAADRVVGKTVGWGYDVGVMVIAWENRISVATVGGDGMQ